LIWRSQRPPDVVVLIWKLFFIRAFEFFGLLPDGLKALIFRINNMVLIDNWEIDE